MEKKKLLVIEDNFFIMRMVQSFLSEIDCQIIHADNGIDGHNIAQKERPEILLIDIMLPGMNGLDIVKSLRNLPEFKNTPIILMSANAEEKDIQSGYDSGCDDYITKPFSKEILQNSIKKYL
ncbi:MAG: response regulator [Spirochaetia bacterium]|nr:response regulator [Spirochaetia bacterium]